ncbi:hypothetical protein G8759_31410 [Spirosoma aureum]|uniref:Uncharacterized protein n=1 Tax=Spirosoma aureum TaxID=2692134 RepID=A0A6G9AXB0_9BACT|nr:hypothetical protein [Spirosoma aureum]QIP16833.1 hypothetical protein G8759_31410 [Spirosoma aureum]
MTELTYKELDINQKINLKGILSAWNQIAIERFQGELAEKVYTSSRRSSRKRSRRRRYASRLSGKLMTDWRSRVYGDSSGGGLLGTQLSFLLYGRFVDMGVGNGIDAAEAKWRRTRKNGEPTTRQPKRWYSRRKGFETHRLRELLTQHYVNVSLDALENFLEGAVTIHV